MHDLEERALVLLTSAGGQVRKKPLLISILIKV